MPFVDRAARPRRPREPENSGRGRERERQRGPATARVCARGGGGVPGRGLDVCVGGRGGEGGSRRHGGGLGALPAAGARRRSRPAGCRRGRPGYRPPPPRRAAGPGPLALRRPSRQGVSRVVGPDAGPGPPLLVRPLAVQVPSAFRRGGLKTPWGVSPVRPWVGGRRARRRGSSVGRGPDPSRRLAPHGLRPLAGAAAAVGWGLYPAAVVVPSSACRARVVCVPRAVWGREPPGACGVSALAPSWAARGSPRGSETFRPLSGVWSRYTCLAGRPEATPAGGVPCQEGLPVSGALSPHRPRTTLSGGSLGSCVDEERS